MTRWKTSALFMVGLTMAMSSCSMPKITPCEAKCDSDHDQCIINGTKDKEFDRCHDTLKECRNQC